MLEKIRSNPHLLHFCVYFISSGLYGLVIAVPGPVIPFMAAKYQLPETDFIFMFWCRSIGFIVGGFLTKIIQNYLTYHQMLFSSAISVATFFIFFPFTFNIPLQGLEVIIAAIGCSTFEIILFMCYMEAFKGNEEQYWFQLSQVAFGICALICPIIVGFTGQMSYFIIGLLFCTLSILYLFLQTPQTLAHDHLGQNYEKQKNITPVNTRTQIGLAFIIFLYYAEETSFGGWISSYSVIKNAFQKEGSAFLLSLFWIAIAVFRLFLASMKASISQKLILLFKLRIFTFITSIILSKMGFQVVSIVFSCIMAGISYSGTYGYALTLPLQFKRRLQPNHTANITIFGTFGEGVMASFAGYLMKFIGPDTFYPFLLIAGLLNFLTVQQTIKSLSDKSQQKQSLLEKEIQLQDR